MNEPHSHRAPDAAPPWHERIREAFKTRYSTYGERSLTWRLLTPAVFVLAGALFVTSAISSDGTDLRPGRYDDLADLALTRSDRVAELNDQRSRLQKQIDALTLGLGGNEIEKENELISGLREPAGLLEVEGPGVRITLDDAPQRVLDDETTDTRPKLVHQQDIQAVANALWAGGAEAITVQGQRIVSTIGIKCVGNSVLLQGVAYPPPYVIAAIGDTDAMLRRVDSDPSILQYLKDVETYELGWDVELEDELRMPAYDGSTETVYSRPLAVPTPTG